MNSVSHSKVIENAKLLGEELMARDFNLSSDGTDNHLLFSKFRNFGVSGSKNGINLR